jgi:hypothetical protein
MQSPAVEFLLRACFAVLKAEVLLYALGMRKTYATDLSDEE